MGFWVAVTIQTPLHRQRLDLSYHFHLIDPAVAGNATNAASNVDAMIEVSKVRQIVNALPQNRLVCFERLANWLER